MKIRTIASGSSGNCLLASAGGCHVLVDAGVSCRRITRALAEQGLTPDDLSGILVTHEHTDHIAGLAVLTKHTRVPIYTSPGTAYQLCNKIAGMDGLIHTINPGDNFEVDAFGVETFATSHDAAQPMGFALNHQGRKAAVVTDLGYVSDAVRKGVSGAHLLVCEANHDPEMLWYGPYPYPLKNRIAGESGHLSNTDGAQLACRCVEHGTHTVILAHLSDKNNTPRLALDAAASALRAMGAKPGRDITLTAAPRSELSAVYEV